MLGALGKVLHIRRELAEAEACFDRALAIEPASPWLHTYLGSLLLLEGRFDRCWAELEWFWRTPAVRAAAHGLNAPRWDGAPLPGGAILLQAPLGGFGDNLMWARYVPFVAKRVGRVVLQCPPELARLFGTLACAVQVVSGADPLPACDAHAPLMSLAHLLDMPDPRQAPPPYVQPRAADAARWAKALGRHRGLKVGLAWAANPAHPAARRRSIPLAELAPLAKVPGVTLVSLQRELDARPAWIAAAGRPLADFADTAGLMSQLDLVISADTAVAHLAGALGRPVWIMLPSQADSRWLLDRDDSPWYPSARLFRQSTAWDWAPVVERVAEELAALAR